MQTLKPMLKARGTKVRSSQLEQFLDFVPQTCPWFPDEGTVNGITCPVNVTGPWYADAGLQVLEELQKASSCPKRTLRLIVAGIIALVTVPASLLKVSKMLNSLIA